MKDIITKEWLQEQNACSGSYKWLSNQKKKDEVNIAHKLYSEQKYDWCLWLLYRKSLIAKGYVWGLLILSYLLSALSFYLSLQGTNNSVAGVAVAVAGVVAVAVAGVVAAAAV